MYRGLLDSRPPPPPHDGRPFAGEPLGTTAGRRGVFWVVLGCRGSSSRSCRRDGGLHK
uniref:Predicted protein n=1 Tax=Hordeum vulgare subsp. vulgare TaxID=112509 RepID=F2DBF7_HORVV|nr:predicted protein [Hordeum vulgare subsp. vulgare]